MTAFPIHFAQPLLILVVTLLASGTSVALGPVAEHQFDAGQARIIVAKRDSQRAQLIIQFQTGAFDDGLVAGLSRVSQHALLFANQSGSGTQLKAEVYDAGGRLEVTLGVRRTRFLLEAPKNKFLLLSKKLLALVLDFKPNQEKFDYLKQLSRNERVDSGGAVDAESFLAGSVIFTEGGENGNEYNNPLFPDSDSLGQIQMDQITKHILEKFRPANAVVVASGNINATKIIKAVRKYRGGTPRLFERPNSSKAMPLEIQRFGFYETHMRVQLVTLETDVQQAAAHLLTAILQDQSMWELRKKGMTFSTSSTLVSREWMDYILVVMPVSESSRVPVRPEVDAFIKSLAEGNINDDTFERNKRFTLRFLQNLDDDYRAIGKLLADTSPTRPLLTAKVMEELANLNKERFLKETKRWLLPSSTVHVVFGRNLKSSTHSGRMGSK
ncbi:MAG: insulinase family protein [Deltaproteobacteria bacterium]|nr:insulinase family protein [Deltaproteobacteria bacterium]